MKTSVIFSVILAVFLVVACLDSNNSNPDVLNSSEYQIVTDETALAARINVLNIAVEIDSSSLLNQAIASSNSGRNDFSQARAEQAVTRTISLTLNAEVSAVSSDGLTLQSTDAHLRGSHAFIGYAMAGDVFSGAVQSVNVANKVAPRLNSEVLFKSIDIFSVAVVGNYLIMAGAADPDQITVSTPAVIVIAGLKSNVPVEPLLLVDVPSFAATDIVIRDQILFATVGAFGGGVARIDLGNPQSFNENNDFFPFEDARSLDEADGWLGVFKGTPGEVLWFQTNQVTDQTIGFSSVNPLRRVTLDGTATIPFSKSTIEMIGRVTLLGVGDGGTIALFNSTGDLANSLFHLPQVSGVSVGLTDELTVTNAASADGELLFRANGEAGVDVFLLDNALDEVVPDESVTPEHLGALIFGTEESANSLYYRNRFLFVSGGLGGMKIVSLD